MSRRKVQEPVVEEKQTGGGLEKRYSHPAFGQITASRVSGLSTLFGSDFQHHHWITLRISEAQLIRNLSTDWVHGRNEIIEVSLSEAQWATFLASMNMGSGVPCTISRRGFELVPGVPFRAQKDEFEEELASKVKRMSERVTQTITEIEEGVGASLSGKKKELLLYSLRRLQQDVSSNLPFLAQQFSEHMESSVEDAKIEIQGYLSGMLNQTGLQALAGQGMGPLSLTSGKEDEG